MIHAGIIELIANNISYQHDEGVAFAAILDFYSHASPGWKYKPHSQYENSEPAVCLAYNAIGNILPNHADNILKYAADDKHWDIIDLIALVMITYPLEARTCKLPLNMFTIWVRNFP